MPEVILNEKFYTIPEVADVLSITELTVKNYVQAGRLKATQVGRRYLITEESVKACLTDGTLKKNGGN